MKVVFLIVRRKIVTLSAPMQFFEILFSQNGGSGEFHGFFLAYS